MDWHVGQMNPDLEHRLWDDAAIEAFGLRNDALYRRFVAAGIHGGAADVAWPYAQHFWSTTAELWGRMTATPYPDQTRSVRRRSQR